MRVPWGRNNVYAAAALATAAEPAAAGGVIRPGTSLSRMGSAVLDRSASITTVGSSAAAAAATGDLEVSVRSVVAQNVPEVDGNVVTYAVRVVAGDDLGFKAEWAPGDGVTLTEVDPLGAFGRAGLPVGRLAHVNGQPITCATDVVQVFPPIAPGGMSVYRVGVVPADPEEREQVRRLGAQQTEYEKQKEHQVALGGMLDAMQAQIDSLTAAMQQQQRQPPPPESVASSQHTTVGSATAIAPREVVPIKPALPAGLPTKQPALQPHVMPPGKYLGPFPDDAPVAVEACDGFRKTTIYVPDPEARGGTPQVELLRAGSASPMQSQYTSVDVAAPPSRGGSISQFSPEYVPSVTPVDAFTGYLGGHSRPAVPAVPPTSRDLSADGIIEDYQRRERALLNLMRHGSPAAEAPPAGRASSPSPAWVHSIRAQPLAHHASSEPRRQALPTFTRSGTASTAGGVATASAAAAGDASGLSHLATIVQRAKMDTARASQYAG
eukprot:TRINITY_DN2226_c4_g1_i1.p2 TRINITY_DN2226_c4_g1~~TRINITY_DN2226_c4_g1_i1.p2  ORF type:complete len:494 (+),score=128.80 TRINITY_DN2226_c4_g1_i1:571-2052(+)